MGKAPELKKQAATNPLVLITIYRTAPLEKTMRFSIIELSRQAVRLVLFNFPRILIFNGRRGHA